MPHDHTSSADAASGFAGPAGADSDSGGGGGSGWIFDIQRFCVHDGPGIRSTVFFKGCPLSCLWCSNPESQSSRPQVLYYANLCKGCGSCAAVCRHGAISLEGGAVPAAPERCTHCGACAGVCAYGARTLVGRSATVDEVCEAVGQDWRYYMQTGGGVTCGGGEALAQPAFLRAVLQKLHDGLGYHTCLDTSGFAPWETIESLLPHLDLILFDIKHMDAGRHKEITGVDNSRILGNLRHLAARSFPVLVRVPLIPGVNDDEPHMHALGVFLREHRLTQVELMPYHAFGLGKYQALGRAYPFTGSGSPATGESVAILESYGVQVETHI